MHGQGLTSRAALELLQGLDKLWVLQLEPFEGAVLVDLVGAVLHVDLEVLFGVRADDVRDPCQPDRLLPTGFQIGEESLGTGSNQDHLRWKHIKIIDKECDYVCWKVQIYSGVIKMNTMYSCIQQSFI